MKGILKSITSRKIAVAITILVQFLVIFLLIAYFDNAFVYYYAVASADSILFGVVVINKKMNSGYKIAWLLLLLLFPVFGLTIFILLEGSWYTKRTKRKMLMFCKFADSASFEQSAKTVGLSERRCAFAAIVTDVSVIPLAIFAKVLPVQGEIIKASKDILGPKGSASTIV